MCDWLKQYIDRLRNEENISITCIAFHMIKKHSIIFADKEGYIGSFESVLSTDKSTTDSGNLTNEDPLMEVSAFIHTSIIKTTYFKIIYRTTPNLAN